jgi:geranylgeranyl transferase type-2 subunit beta
LLKLAGSDVLAGSPADWPERVGSTLETFRTGDGGYAKAAGSGGGSVYHTFLVGLCQQLLGKTYPGGNEVLRFVQGRRRDDGGYVEIGAMRRSGTNPTAAAVGIFQIVEEADERITALTPAIRSEVGSFLAGMVSAEGGLRGNGRAPVADLLSTFTGVWTLDQLEALDRIDLSQAWHYAQALELPEGGFRGGLWDTATDVEYTFYGLGCLALLSKRLS